MVDIIKNYVTNNMHYKNNRIINVKGLVIHSVGCPQPDPDVFARNWNKSDNKYLAQLVIGAEKTYEVLPCMQTSGSAVFCWHVGSANGHTIGAEMTEPATIKYTGGATWVDLNPEKTKAHVLATYANAVDVFAQCCVFHNLDPLKDGVILSHKECHARGIGTNHGDVEHLWNKFGLTMEQFRKDIKAAMGNMTPNTDTSYTPELSEPSEPSQPSECGINKGDIVKIAADAVYYNGKSIPSWVKNQNWIVKDVDGDRVVIDKNVAGTHSINSPINIKYLTLIESNTKPDPFMVKVNIRDLNMRTGPATSYPRIGYIPKGVYTIVSTSGKWGKLKSKQEYEGKYVDAWIHLDYTTKL